MGTKPLENWCLWYFSCGRCVSIKVSNDGSYGFATSPYGSDLQSGGGAQPARATESTG